MGTENKNNGQEESLLIIPAFVVYKALHKEDKSFLKKSKLITYQHTHDYTSCVNGDLYIQYMCIGQQKD